MHRFFMKGMLSIVLAAGILAGCASPSTKFTNLWKDAKYEGPKLKKILVIAVLSEETNRRSFETDFASDFKRRNIEAVGSYEVFPGESQMDKEKLVELLKGKDFDGVLVARVIGVEKKAHYSPGYTSAMPSYGYGGYYGHYSSSFSVVHSPGYYKEYKRIRLETALYAVKDEQLVWSGSTATKSYDNYVKEMSEYTSLIITAIHEAGLI